MLPQVKRFAPPLLALLLAVWPLAAQEPNRNARFGLPSPAKADPRQREDYLIARPQFVLSYNNRTRTANWVCWHLRKGDIGKADRGPFEPDPLLPKGFTKVTSREYIKSGFDRGHLCPSKDRSDSEGNNDPTFSMTNVVLQGLACKQRSWACLEDYCRAEAQKGHELQVVPASGSPGAARRS